MRQDGDLAEMIWPVPDIIALASCAMRLMPGDLVFTGTPSGVGRVLPGDRLTGAIDGVGRLTIEIAGS